MTLSFELKLPNLNSLRGSTKKQMGPMEKLQDWFIKEVGLETAKDSWLKLHLRLEEEKKIDKLTYKYCKSKYPWVTRQGANSAVTMYNLQLAPASFLSNPKWTRKGYAYLKKEPIDKLKEAFPYEV